MFKEKMLYALMLIFFCLAALWLLGSARAWADDMEDFSAAAADSNVVQLDGSSSSDPDGDQLLYRWRQVGGPLVRLNNSTTARPSFHPLQPGKYAFELTVSDGKSTSAPAVVEVEVERANRAPLAALAPKLGSKTGQRVTLDASRSSDPDGDTLRYAWRQVGGPAQVINPKETAVPQLNLIFPQEGRYTIELVANDGNARSNPVRCEVVVTNPNAIPVARINQPSQKIALRLPGAQPDAAATPADNAPTAALDNDNLPAAAHAAVAPETTEKDRDAVFATMRRDADAPQNRRAPANLPTAAREDDTRPTARPQIATTSRNVRILPAERNVPAPAAQPTVARPSQPTNRETSGNAALDQELLSGGGTGAEENGKNEVNVAAARLNATTGKTSAPTRARGGIPVATTSGNQMVEVGELVRINGRGTDPAGGQLRYTWRQTGGPQLDKSLLNRSRDLEFTPAKDGTYLFELFVSNDLGEVSEPSEVAVTVAKPAGDYQSLVGNDELLAETTAGTAPGKETGKNAANITGPQNSPAASARAAGKTPEEDVPGITPVPPVENKGNGMFGRVFRRTQK